MERIERTSDEADLSAQEAPPRQGARLSGPDEDDGRPPHPRRSTGSRTQAPHGLTGRGTASPRLVMLSSPRDFATIQDRGTSRSHPLLVARFLRNERDDTRFGLATGRRLGNAVVRNRARRRLREALRSKAGSIQPGWDVLIVARPALVTSEYRTIVEALDRLLGRAGILGEKG